MNEAIEVSASRVDGGTRRFAVRLGKHSYDVGVSEADLAELAGGAPAEQLVRESFAFLLEREPPQSILSRFDLAVISRYFPDYRSEIARRMRDARGA